MTSPLAHPATRPDTGPLPVRTGRQRPGPATLERALLLGAIDTAPRCARATIAECLTLWGLGHLTDDAQAITSEQVFSEHVLLAVLLTCGNTHGGVSL
jgi:hypothetical protein